MIGIGLLLFKYLIKLSATSHYSKIYLFNFEVGYPTPKFIESAENYLNLVNFEYEKPSIDSDIFLLQKCLEKKESTDPVLCLRCRISNAIYLTISGLYEKFKNKLKIEDLSSFVLDDEGLPFLKFKSSTKSERIIINWKILQERLDLKKPLTLEILRTFDKNKSNLNTWTQRMVRGDANLRKYLRSNDVQLLTKWPRIAGTSKSKLEKSLEFNSFKTSKIEELLKLHNSFVVNYREAKKFYIKEKKKQMGWEPDLSFYNKLEPSKDILNNLDLIYESIKKFDEKIKKFKDQEYEKDYYAVNDQINPLFDTETISLVKETVEKIGKEFVKLSINNDKKKWLKDKNREKCWRLYADGLSQRDIAKECSHKQGWVSKLLKEKNLSETIALQTLIKLSKLPIMKNLRKNPSELDKARESLRNQILNPKQYGNRSLMQYWIYEALK